MSETSPLAELLTPSLISLNCEVSSKKRLLEEMANLLASDPDVTLSAKEVFGLLLEREKMGNTGIGAGVALPHSRCSSVPKAVLAIISVSPGIDYDSIDREPVTLAFGLLVPQEASDQHLSILSQIAKLMRQDGRMEQIMNATNSAQLIDLIAGWQNH